MPEERSVFSTFGASRLGLRERPLHRLNPSLRSVFMPESRRSLGEGGSTFGASRLGLRERPLHRLNPSLRSVLVPSFVLASSQTSTDGYLVPSRTFRGPSWPRPV